MAQERPPVSVALLPQSELVKHVSQLSTPKLPDVEFSLRILINQAYDSDTAKLLLKIGVVKPAQLPLQSDSSVLQMLALWLLFHLALTEDGPHAVLPTIPRVVQLISKAVAPDLLEKACWLLTALSSSDDAESTSFFFFFWIIIDLILFQLVAINVVTRKYVLFLCFDDLKIICKFWYCLSLHLLPAITVFLFCFGQLSASHFLERYDFQMLFHVKIIRLHLECFALNVLCFSCDRSLSLSLPHRVRHQ